MDVKKSFAALETACREQARVAQNDVGYWLNEADEWARLATDLPIESPLQLELLQRDYR
jgi:hypothetical protein